MADTPILNYKGKYDGPEIDKAIELALGLENPESCPYYVHISLSQPDYVLTIGLGDAEGNLFNHAEIDLPLESMVVNATYENGNIILHLQDGTSTEPIPISALIAGLVSETRTIAGIDLKDDITQKELRDALDVYTKGSVDQLVSDLEDRINETLNEMEQSLNDLSELTSDHDTQIKKNTSDISVNRATLGTQCKNELVIVQKSLSNYKGINVIVNDDKSIIITGTPTESVYLGIGSFYPKKTGKYILSGCPTGGGFNSHILYFPQIQKYDVGNSITIDITTTETLTVNILVKNGIEHNLTFYPMIRPADITDPTYEPYKPSVNERLVEVEESVSELTPQVEQNKSDILKAQKQTGAIAISSIGWYRIFKADRLGASRSSIIRLARGYNSKPAETITLFFNLQYNTPQQKLVYCNIINKFCHYQIIDKIRVVVPANFGVNDIVYIDLHHNASVSNPIQATMFDETVQPSSYGFFSIVNLEPVAENIEGYTSYEFDLTGKDIFERLDALETALTQTTE